MTYKLDTTPRPGTIDDEPGMAQYVLSNEYGEVCYMWLPVDDVDFWARLLNAQAKKAWEKGFAEGKRQDAEGDDGPRFTNPYTIQEKEKNHHEKATHCPHSYYAPRCMCSTASGH